MSRLPTLLVVATVLLLPAAALAGGPPQLCLPIEGVTPDNRAALVERLANELGDRLWSGGRSSGVSLLENENGSYAILALRKNVRLSEIQAALKGTPFSVPLQDAHLVSAAILELQVPVDAIDALTSSLATLPNLEITATEQTADGLRLTLNADSFTRHLLRQEASQIGAWPRYEELRAIIARHDARLQDLLWSSDFHCRMFGCVSKSEPTVAAAAAVAAQE